MLTVHAHVDDDDDGLVRTEGYGYGWFIGSVSGGHRVIYRTGNNVGFLALNAWFPLRRSPNSAADERGDHRPGADLPPDDNGSLPAVGNLEPGSIRR